MDFKIQTSRPSNYTTITNKKVNIPALCPICGVSNNPTTNGLQTSSNFAFFSHHCTACNQTHYSIQDISEDIGLCRAVYPNSQPTDLPDQIVNFSSRFVKMYRDAEFAESNDAFDLAGVGYRASLEILLKDYALEFDLDNLESIAKTNLNNAISKYFKNDLDVQIAADVVRIIGNDYAHWKKEDDYDLDILKSYLQIFINLINTKLMLKNPPVSRTKK